MLSRNSSTLPDRITHLQIWPADCTCVIQLQLTNKSRINDVNLIKSWLTNNKRVSLNVSSNFGLGLLVNISHGRNSKYDRNSKALINKCIGQKFTST